MRKALARGRSAKIAVLPTQLTLCNAVCGFGSLTLAAQVVDPSRADQRLFYAGLLIFAAMVFDMLDGHVARLMRQTTRFGGQLDSLSDAVSFGLAPAFLVLHSTSAQLYHPRLLWMVSVLYVICVLVRLARYNSEVAGDDAHIFFSGLPSPASAGLIASFALATPTLEKLSDTSMSPSAQKIGQWLLVAADVSLPIVTMAVAVLMVSRIRYPHVGQWFSGRRQFHHIVQLIFAIVAVCAVHELAIPLIFLFFVVGSPVRAAWTNPVVREARKIPRRSWPRRGQPVMSHRRDHPRRDGVRGWRRRLRAGKAAQRIDDESGVRDGYSKDAFPRK